MLNTAPRAPQALDVYPWYICWSASANPELPILPSPASLKRPFKILMAVKKVSSFKKQPGSFPGGPVGFKNPPCNAGDTGWTPGLGRSYTPRSNEICMPQPLGLRSGARDCDCRTHVPQRLKPTAWLEPVFLQQKPPQPEACPPQGRVALARRS